MNAVSPSFAAASAAGGAADTIALRWHAVLDAANVVAVLAGHEPEEMTPETAGFPARIALAEEWRRQRAENGIADLAAVLEPGLAALLSINSRGSDPKPAASALWREFVAARTAVLALVPIGSVTGTRRAV
jgi:hypothetical protein